MLCVEEKVDNEKEDEKDCAYEVSSVRSTWR